MNLYKPAVSQVTKLGVLTLRHESGIKIDFCCATEEDRKERVLSNSNLIRWYTEERIFQVTVQAIKTLFEGTPVLQTEHNIVLYQKVLVYVGSIPDRIVYSEEVII
eukprot:sb/3477835/